MSARYYHEKRKFLEAAPEDENIEAVQKYILECQKLKFDEEPNYENLKLILAPLNNNGIGEEEKEQQPSKGFTDLTQKKAIITQQVKVPHNNGDCVQHDGTVFILGVTYLDVIPKIGWP